MPDLAIGDRAEDVIDFMNDHLGGLFDAVASVLNHLLGWTYQVFAALVPLAMAIVLALVALAVTRKLVLSAGLFLGLLLVDAMELWFPAMQTMTAVVVASVIALLFGIPLGIACAFSRPVNAVVNPVLDLMQTIPVFVYLLPSILFFGIGDVPGVVATIIFAAPPAVRLTALGIRQVDAETVEAAHAFGAPRFQVLREVQLPLARPSLMAGINQVIMLALSMVVVGGLVGGGGLGKVVVTSVQNLQIPESVESGLAVVILAIFLDRVSAAAGGVGRGNPSWWPRRRAAVGIAAASQPLPPVAEPESDQSRPVPA